MNSFFVGVIPVDLNEGLNTISTGNPFRVNNLMTLLSNLLGWSIFFGALIIFFCLLFSGIQWMSAGGDKGAVQVARDRIANCLVGFAVLACSYAIVLVVQFFFGITIFQLPGTPAPVPPGPIGPPLIPQGEYPLPHTTYQNCNAYCNSVRLPCTGVGTDADARNGEFQYVDLASGSCVTNGGLGCAIDVSPSLVNCPGASAGFLPITQCRCRATP